MQILLILTNLFTVPNVVNFFKYHRVEYNYKLKLQQ